MWSGSMRKTCFRATPRGRPTRRGWAAAALLACALWLAGLPVEGGVTSGPTPAFAQGQGFPFFGGWGREQPRPRRPVGREDNRGGFFPFFNWGEPRYRTQPEEPQQRSRRPVVHSDPTKPPAPQKADTQAAKTVLVLGDGMADWLAYGLEEAFEDSAGEFGAVRRAKAGSGLIKNEPRDYDWVQGTREMLAKEKADVIVMMIGLGDRHAIKERPAPRTEKQGQPLALQSKEQPNIAAPEPEKSTAATNEEFRSDKWIELYGKRVDDMIAVLRNKRVPVLWVGLPPIRGPKSRADISALNDIYRAEAQKAGITYVDVWEGFLDESGDSSSYGPDVIGQVRRLRSSDGVFFTKSGARKLAHFVDREIKRVLNRDTPLSLPLPEMPEKVPDDLTGPAPRPVAGPVVPLTGGTPASGGSLLGGSAVAQRDPEAPATKVLVNGEPPPPVSGRADNFTWPSSQKTNENETVEPPREPATAAARPARPAAQARERQRPATQAAPASGPMRLGPQAR
jgi:hypothetical protein